MLSTTCYQPWLFISTQLCEVGAGLIQFMTGNSSLSCCACWPPLIAASALPGSRETQATRQSLPCGTWLLGKWDGEAERTWQGSHRKVTGEAETEPISPTQRFHHKVIQSSWQPRYPSCYLTLSTRCWQSLLVGLEVWIHLSFPDLVPHNLKLSSPHPLSFS